MRAARVRGLLSTLLKAWEVSLMGILQFALGSECAVAESAEEARLLALLALRETGRRREVGVLGFVDGDGSSPSAGWTRRQLRIAVNLNTGFGGLIWYALRGTGSDPVSNRVWVSDNRHPRDADPMVVSDTHVPIFLARRSVLPVSRIEEAVEEFCRVGTGARPECIEWAEGQVNGLLLGMEAPRVPDGGPFWAFRNGYRGNARLRRSPSGCVADGEEQAGVAAFEAGDIVAEADGYHLIARSISRSGLDRPTPTKPCGPAETHESRHRYALL
jgi:hypothetical protein